MSREFIKDVIYHLKHEYGAPAIVTKTVETLNIATGIKTQDVTSYTIPKVIDLPTDRREALLKSLGIHTVSHMDLDKKQFLVDADDIGSFPLENGQIFEVLDSRHTVKSVERFPYAFIVTTSNISEPL